MNESLLAEYFLYPLSEHSDYTLNAGGSVTPENFWAEAMAASTSVWGLSNGFRLVEPGDWVWAYFGGSVQRICGVGTVRGPVEWDQDWGKFTVRIVWDRALTARLRVDPINYVDYRQRVQGAVVRANELTRGVLDRWVRRVDPEAATAARAVKFAQREVTQRLGQHRFREDALRAYGGACAITGCREGGVLQAAHIEPVSGGGVHAVANSIVLRADLHNLFDLGKLTVGQDLKVRLVDEVTDPAYRELVGQPVRPPKGATRADFRSALARHRAIHR